MYTESASFWNTDSVYFHAICRKHGAKVGAAVSNAVRDIEFDDDIPAFDEGTLAMLRAAFGQPVLQIAG
jgi:hypothetical protein